MSVSRGPLSHNLSMSITAAKSPLSLIQLQKNLAVKGIFFVVLFGNREACTFMVIYFIK